jgi:hypothetical protein
MLTLNQDSDNQGERNYILRSHMEMNRNLTYEHDMDAKKGNKDTQNIIDLFGPEECKPRKSDLFWWL